MGYSNAEFLHKKFKFSSIIIEGVRPSLSELNLFEGMHLNFRPYTHLRFFPIEHFA